jgi:hypothetical protein
MSSPEPGLDLHAWESEMELLKEDLHTSPADALPQLVDLVGRMLVERGYSPDEVAASPDPEVVGEFLRAREVAGALAAGEDNTLGDVADAVQRLTRIYELVLGERRAP